MKALLVLLVLVGCTADRPAAPYVRLIIADDNELPAYLDGARGWSPLGFDFGFEWSGLPECPRAWWTVTDFDPDSCEVSILLKRDPWLREKTGTDALANRRERLIVIDTRVTDYYQLITATAHEVGHIVLDTSEHTRGGIMGGSSWSMHEVDRELACRTIGICL